MSRPSRLLEAQVIGVRLPGALVEQLDQEITRRQAEHPGMLLTRADLIREGVYLLLGGGRVARPLGSSASPSSTKTKGKSTKRASLTAPRKVSRRGDKTSVGSPLCPECDKPNPRNPKKTPYCSEACKKRAQRRAGKKPLA
jgi:hypothetical protein